MTSFEELSKEVDRGLLGMNEGLPLGFNRLNRYIGLRKRLYFLIGGLTGSGKTSLLDDAFVLNPYEFYKSPENKTDIKFKVIYRSMERSRYYKIAKWVIRKVFIDQGIILPLGTLLGWKGFDKLTKDEHDLFLMYQDYINNMEDTVTIIDGPENPVGVAKELKEYALKNGRIEQLDEYNKVYIPNHSNEIVILIIDHLGKLKLTKDLTTKKAAIDKMSDELSYARDFFGYTPIAVSQFNRQISNIQRLKNGDVEPQLEDFKESGQSQDDCDIAISLFDPSRYKVADPSGYDLDKLTDQQGAKYFRSLRIIKNSMGIDDVRTGLAFFGEIGKFSELPKRSIITDDDYSNILNKSYFLNVNK